MKLTSTRARLMRATALIGGAAILATFVLPTSATAERDRGKPGGDSSQALQKAVTTAGVMRHLQQFELIGDETGSRASGTPGYAASRDYVVQQLRKAGYRPTVQAFDFPFFEQLEDSVFEQTAPTPTTYVEDTDYGLMTYSGSGDVTAPVEAVDLNLGDLPGSTSGCEDADFAGFTAGNIALVRRGFCPFGDKVVNAQEAGAAAVIVMNTGTPGNEEAFAGTLGAPVATVPAIGTSFEIGEALNVADAEAHISTSTASEIRETWNVIAETRQGRQDNVVMAGAHLDSVTEGNGINDNGSGSGALLEVAEQFAEKVKKPKNTVRFAWWGAEELNLLGSTYYVNQLAENNPGALQDIALYLNFDMVGSPNYSLFVYDGDNSAFPPGPGAAVGPPGSGAIEQNFHRFFDRRGTGSAETAFSGRSDYGPFIAEGIPAGGLFTGAEGVKTPEQAAQFGGQAGVAYDKNYHAEGDDLSNVNRDAINHNSDAIADAIWTFARSTRPVNGERSGHNPAQKSAVKQHRGSGSLTGDDHRHGHQLPLR